MRDLLKVKVDGSDYLCKWEPSNVVEIGGREYPFIKIGNKLWITENLDYAWSGLTIGGSVGSDPRANYYDNDETTYGWNGYKCGLLYNWAAVGELANLLPDGWHVPSNNEWTELMNATPDVYQAAYSLSNGSLSWAPDWTGENMYELNLIPGGQRYGSNGTFHRISTGFNIWSSNRYDWWRSGSKFVSEYVNNNTQLSIRLVKDAT